MARKIFVIDDSRTVREHLKEVLTNEGFEVVTPTLEEAHQAVREHSPCTILMDTHRHDGACAFIGEIRASESYQNLPIIVLSKHADIDHRLHVANLGANEFISKPYKASNVARVINYVLRPRRRDDKNLILLVDDSMTFRKHLRRSLEYAGYLVEEASDGFDGLKAVDTLYPDLIIVDNHMPKLNGPGMIRTLKFEPMWRNTPCLLLTGDSGPSNELDALAAGADAYASKSSSREVILHRIAAMLRRPGSPGAPQHRGRVIVADEGEGFLREVAASLIPEWFDVLHIKTLNGFRKAIENFEIDGVILDPVSFHPNGEDMCRELRSSKNSRAILVVTGPDAPENALRALQAGADDFVPMRDVEVLLGRLKALLRRYRIEQLHRRALEGEHIRARERVTQRMLEEKDALVLELEARNSHFKLLTTALNRAKSEAESANAAKTEYLANISHEIRNPLNAMLGSLELLSQEDLKPGWAKLLDAAVRGGIMLKDLLDDTLDLTKVESGRLELDHSPFDLGKILTNTLDLFAQRAHEKGLELVVMMRPQVPLHYIGDGKRLTQILNNLVSNAIKFTPEGGIQVSIRYDSGFIISEVTDTGIGISSDKLDKIFESYRQANAAVNTTYGGTGLGLAISRKLAEAMGGDLTVTSDEGRGATFRVRVKVDRCAGPSTSNRSSLGDLQVVLLRSTEWSEEAVRQALGGYQLEVVDSLANLHIDLSHETLILVDEPSRFDADILTREILEYKQKYRVWVVTLSTAENSQVAGQFDGQFFKPIIAPCFIDELALIVSKTEQEPSICPLTSEIELDGIALVVDDRPANLEVCGLMLESLGCTPICADNGLDALDILRKVPVDIALLDWHMPQMDGGTLVSKIRKEFGTTLPIVMLTADNTVELRKRARSLGVNDMIKKPVSLSTLKATVKKWLAKPVPGSEPQNLVLEPLQQLQALAKDSHSLTRVVGTFVGALQDFLPKIEFAAEEKSTRKLKDIAHAIHGSAANFGAARVGELALMLEERASKEDEHTWQLAHELRIAISRYIQSVETWLVATSATQ